MHGPYAPGAALARNMRDGGAHRIRARPGARSLRVPGIPLSGATPVGRFALVLLVCVAACARPRQPSDAPAPEPLRLCIRNATVGYGNIIASAGPVRFTILPGQEQCRPVSDVGPGIQLSAVTTGGGVAGPISFSNTLRAGIEKCWLWNLTNTPGSGLNLEPCD